MSFVGVLDSNSHKTMWSRAVMSLAAISDHIKFIITKQSLSLSAVNSAKTSHGEIIFNRSFFHDYYVDFSDILPEGYGQETDEQLNNDGVDSDSGSYSFLINSKHLATLFKNLDANNLDYICFKIYWSVSAPETMKYKFLIEIKTKKLIIKKYQTNYQPVFRNKVKVAQIYRQELQSTQEQEENTGSIVENRINHISIEHIIPKQFLDMIPATTEDFKIDVKNEKISFSGYTKQVLKDREYLKQPMSVTITLNLDELVSTNLSQLMSGEEPMKKCINYRLKDFRNFLNLIGSFSSTSVSEGDEYINLNKIDSGESFEILFKNPGDPVLFESQNNPHVFIQFIQLTAKDENTDAETTNRVSTEDPRKAKMALSLLGHTIHRIERVEEPVSRPIAVSQLPAPSQPLNIPRLHSNRPSGRLPDTRTSVVVPIHRTPEPSQNIPSSMEVEDFVTYRKESTPPSARRKRRLQEMSEPSRPTPRKNQKSAVADDTDYSDTDDETNRNENQNQASEKEISYGPTQLNNRPKSIF
ncbi:DNA damage checkpoint protein [Scheffersomyces stipitis CBS 6054]|uniref:DNA damage checkpoint protein n=1 Tax=Scheffersomyces stipitis (strain ATCC 58785 / CBS 6054 / NBRC 10063 / NRRL Y-11545) TaxID=322104 RepID=A3LUD1_PICST|nr:DNA damage checkpoint protein [Scheffersomyces stipitis CBS 6054]ABN66219.2 DNA damage checkpoint protein [Scheffersomyces stipitis CBS 6054]